MVVDNNTFIITPFVGPKVLIASYFCKIEHCRFHAFSSQLTKGSFERISRKVFRDEFSHQLKWKVVVQTAICTTSANSSSIAGSR